MTRVWKFEVFSTTQRRILVIIRWSIKENLLISRFRKSHQFWLVTQLENLHGSDGCQTLRSRLTVLSLRQDLVHGVLRQFHLIIGIILPPSFLAIGFLRLSRWAFSTPFCSAPTVTPPSFHFLHDVEVTLGVSFNAQSQATDIPGISSRNTLSPYFGSFNTHCHPVQGPGHPHTVVTHFHSRTPCFLQLPRSSS